MTLKTKLICHPGVERMLLGEKFEERESRWPGGRGSLGAWLGKAFQDRGMS